MEQVFGLLAVELGVAQVHQDQVHVGAAGQDGDAGVGDVRLVEAVGDDPGAFQDALLAFLEFLGAGDLEGHGLGGDHVHERSALLAGEDVGVDLLGPFLLGQDHAGAGAGEGLVHGGGDDVGVRHRARVQPGGHEAGEVRHVRPEQRAHLVGDRAEGCEVEVARVRGPAGDDHLRLLGDGLLAELVHVDPEVVFLDLVGGDLVELAGEVQLHAVGQVAAVGQGQAQDLVPRGDHGGERRGVGLGTGVRLDVGVFGAEELLDAVDRELLGDVDVFAAAVVAAAGVALGVFVGQDRALGFHHGARGEVLGGDHFQGAALAAQFLGQDGGDFGIEFGQ